MNAENFNPLKLDPTKGNQITRLQSSLWFLNPKLKSITTPNPNIQGIY